MAGLRLGGIERGVEVGPLQVRVDQGEHPGHVALAARLVGRTDQGLVFLGHEPQYRAPDAWPVQRLISASSWRRAGPGANITSSWSSGWPVARSTRTGSISAPVRLFRYPHDSSGHGGTIGTGALISFMSGARLTLCVSGSWQSV